MADATSFGQMPGDLGFKEKKKEYAVPPAPVTSGSGEEAFNSGFSAGMEGSEPAEGVIDID